MLRGSARPGACSVRNVNARARARLEADPLRTREPIAVDRTGQDAEPEAPPVTGP